MKKITDFFIEKKEEMKVPEKGYYVCLNYMFGDADGYDTDTIGPWPINKPEYLIDFLNVLNMMLEAFENGMGHDDCYEDVIPELNKYFDRCRNNEVTEEDKILNKICRVGIKQCPEVYCLQQAELVDYTIYYQDGICLNKYSVSLVSE